MCPAFVRSCSPKTFTGTFSYRRGWIFRWYFCFWRSTSLACLSFSSIVRKPILWSFEATSSEHHSSPSFRNLSVSIFSKDSSRCPHGWSKIFQQTAKAAVTWLSYTTLRFFLCSGFRSKLLLGLSFLIRYFLSRLVRFSASVSRRPRFLLSFV